MGAPYSTTTITGFNSDAPPDDGSQNASNLVTWAAHKTKLGDPLKTAIESINTKLVAAADIAVRQIGNNDSTVATDHDRIVEIGPNVSTAVTVSLGTASTMTNSYRVFIRNSCTIAQTIGRVTASDTINGVAANITIPSGASFGLQTTTGADGYLLIAAHPFDAVNVTEETAPAVSDRIPLYDISTGKVKYAEVQRVATVQASETVAGKLELATQAEVNEGSDTIRGVTPATLGSYVRAAVLTYETLVSSTTDAASPYTFAGTDIGTAHPTRHVHLVIHTYNAGAEVTSVTVDGRVAVRNVTLTATAGICSIWTAYVPAGTTADIVVACGSPLAVAVGVYSSTGLWHEKAYDQGSSGSDPGTDTLATREGGFCIAGWSRNAADTVDWTNVTETYEDGTFDGGRGYSGASAATPSAGTISPSANMTSASNAVTVFATF